MVITWTVNLYIRQRERERGGGIEYCATKGRDADEMCFDEERKDSSVRGGGEGKREIGREEREIVRVMPLDQNIQHFEKIRDSRFYDSWTESQRSLGERSLCLVTLVTEIVLCFPDVMLLPARTSIFG